MALLRPSTVVKPKAVDIWCTISTMWSLAQLPTSAAAVIQRSQAARSSQVMERDGSLVVAGQAAPKELAADLRAVAKALRPAQRLQPCLAMSH
jgi:hypothetical protein